MTGMDVMERCRAYERDMERLRLQAAMARDAVTRATRSADTIGHGGGEDRIAAYTARVDALARAMDARTAMHEAELLTAARLIAALDTAQGQAIYHLYILGETVRQTDAAMHTTEASVRGLRRRAKDALAGMDTQMGEGYAQAAARYAEYISAARGENG